MRERDFLIALLMTLLLVAVGVYLSILLVSWMDARPARAAAPVSAGPTPTSDAGAPVLPPTPEPTAEPPAATPLPPTPIPAPATIMAGANGVNVRAGPGTDFARIGILNPGAEANVIGRCADWWQIEYDGAPAWVASWVVTAWNVEGVPEVPPPTPVPASPVVILPPAAPPEIDETRWIDVDLTNQVLTAYENGVPVRTTLVSTGLPNTPTPTGQFRIWIKLRTDDMAGEDYYLEDVPYVMYFYQGYGLHGVTWHGNFGHPMSHGCVNLPTEEAEWLFSWADVGTLVNVHA